uniref:RHS repeat-associated core domain-containing protein n=1 Tax=uncultured Stenotrophomonas sp. TaxID=165438 RepID=UPI002804F94B
WEWSNKSEVFGNQIPSADPDGDGVAFELALRFPGQQATDASGLFYNYQREYDPAVGRYSQSDPIGLMGGLVVTRTRTPMLHRSWTHLGCSLRLPVPSARPQQATTGAETVSSSSKTRTFPITVATNRLGYISIQRKLQNRSWPMHSLRCRNPRTLSSLG